MALMNDGKGDLDHSAIVTFIEEMAGIEVKRSPKRRCVSCSCLTAAFVPHRIGAAMNATRTLLVSALGASHPKRARQGPSWSAEAPGPDHHRSERS